jgi:hypothetical protein
MLFARPPGGTSDATPPRRSLRLDAVGDGVAGFLMMGGAVRFQRRQGLGGGAVEGGEELHLVLGRREPPPEGPPRGRDVRLGPEQLP